MADISGPIALIAAAWLFAVLLTARFTMRSTHGSVGLPTAFLLSTTFLYIGFTSYLVPGYSHDRIGGNLYLKSYAFTEQTVYLGALGSVLGILGFSVGCWLMTPRRAGRQQSINGTFMAVDPQHRQKLLLVLGGFALVGLLLTGRQIPIPMMQAVLQVARNVAVVVICLGASFALFADRGNNYGKWLAAGVAIPAFYLIGFGFTSYGFIVLTCFAGYWLAVLVRQQIGPMRALCGGVAVTYSLLSLFVAWMSYRNQLREILWDRSTGLSDRLDAVVNAFSAVEWLRPSNFESLDWLNIRLNQYLFVGKAIEWHEAVPDLRLYGESIFVAIFAWVPRFLWPGKPEMGGSDFVSVHTGRQFSEDATFGIGPIFEFYVNFGWVGIFPGCLLLGMIVRWIDRCASVALRQGRWMDFARWFAVGLAFIAPLTSFFFVVNTALISYAVLTVIKYAIGQGVPYGLRSRARKVGSQRL